MEKSSEPIIEAAPGYINSYQPDQLFYALWKYANSDRLVGKSVCSFDDITGLDSNVLFSSLSFLRMLTDFKIPIAGLEFHTDIYKKYNKAMHQKLLDDIEKHANSGVWHSLKKLLENQPLGPQELDDVLFIANRYNLHEWFEFDKPRGKVKDFLDQWINNYLNLFIGDGLAKDRENYFRFAKQKEMTSSTIRSHYDKYGSSFILYYPERLPQFSNEPEYLPIHTFASLEKLGLINIEAIWIFDMELPPEKQTEQYRIKLTIQPALKEFFETFYSSIRATPNSNPVLTAQVEKTYFDADKSTLYILGKPVKLTKFSDQYHLVRIIFEDKNRLNDEWFFSEIAEKWDDSGTINEDKKFYNATYQVGQKIAKDAHIEDFFITTKQSVKIDPKYLSQP